MDGQRETRPGLSFLMIAAAALAGFGALPYAGSWNDGSRLASVEAIVDHGTLAIDESIFVKVHANSTERGYLPYRAPGCLAAGTRDKLFIDGHFYSDKPALVSVLMALVYQVWQWLGGPAAALRPDLFCLLMTWSASGAAYVLAVACVYLLARRLDVSPRVSLLLAASLAFATMAPIYARHVNNHIVLLGVMAALFLQLVSYALEHERGESRNWRLVVIGTLAGIGYALDLGLGPVLVATLAGAILWRTRSPAKVALTVLAALPWLAAHHALNYAIGGTLKPANAAPEYLVWEGSPFTQDNLTGLSRHSPWNLGVYAMSLLHGKHGLLGYNLPLLLAIVGGWVGWRELSGRNELSPTAHRSPSTAVGQRQLGLRPEMAFAICWCAGGWLMYAVFSNNYGGVCCSIRWFVPFLAAGYFLIAVLLRERPTFAWDLAVLSFWGLSLAAVLWSGGPWSNKVPSLYWPIQAAALLSWWQCRRWRSHAERRLETEAPLVACRVTWITWSARRRRRRSVRS